MYFRCWGGRGRPFPGVCKPVYLTYLENSRPVREPVLKNTLPVSEEWYSKLPFGPHMHIMYIKTCTHIHT